MIKKWTALIMAILMVTSMAALFVSCSPETDPGDEPAEAAQEETDQSGSDDKKSVTLAAPDMSAWHYNKKADVFYQTGIPYCSKPADGNLEMLSIFVPGAYMGGTKNDDGTYTCKIRSKVKVKGYTASTAPIVMPVDTPGFTIQLPLNDYVDVDEYTDKGFVYVHAGCRGKESGAPAGVADLKAAVRYLRFCEGSFPGDTESIFTFGMSGGGSQAAVLGSSGDSSLYEPYLKGIGAVMETSDAIKGVMAWCPVTGLDVADAAYEWLMGSSREGLPEKEQKVSDGLAEIYATYINSAELRNSDGIMMSLRESEEGIYKAGTYYDHMVGVVEKSLNNFLRDTEFPYKSDEVTTGGLSLKGTYNTPKAYIKALNKEGKWVKYNVKKKKVTVTDLDTFVKLFKPAEKGLGAFDNLNGGTSENILFGYGDNTSGHFDIYLAELLNSLNNDKTAAFAGDLAKEDKAGNDVDTRVDMYTPLYYILRSENGYGKSKVAEFWRIRSGIEQTDCSLSSEVDLTLALRANENVKNVDFATVWGKGHTRAERTGTSTANFIKWVNKCMKDK